MARETHPAAGEALVIVDPQVDFCPGGALAVVEGERVMPVLSELAAAFAAAGAPIYVTRDWHPPQTRHFDRWPPHCVQGSHGAEFHPDLHLPPGYILVSTGTKPDEDGYSGFEGRTPAGRPLAEDMRARGVRSLHVGGLATDYCVRATVLEARARGFEVTVHKDAIRAVEVTPGDGERALDEMRRAGARITS